MLDADPQLASKVKLDEWIYHPGIPANAPQPKSDAFTRVEEQANNWLQGKTPAVKLQTKDWSTQEWLHLLSFLPQQMNRNQLDEEAREKAQKFRVFRVLS